MTVLCVTMSVKSEDYVKGYRQKTADVSVIHGHAIDCLQGRSASYGTQMKLTSEAFQGSREVYFFLWKDKIKTTKVANEIISISASWTSIRHHLLGRG